jgi:hypothetical protein
VTALRRRPAGNEEEEFDELDDAIYKNNDRVVKGRDRKL